MSILRRSWPLEQISYEQWWRELKQQSQNAAEPEESRKAFATLLMALSAPHFLFYKRPPMDDRNTREGLAGSGVVCRPVDASLIATYISFWREIGFLAERSEAAVA